MVITSGYRTIAEHRVIYQRINKKRVNEGKSPISIPMFSKHLKCAAVDIADIGGALYEFLKDNYEQFGDESILVEYDLYMEHRVNTPTHTHLQTKPPASGSRIFIA